MNFTSRKKFTRKVVFQATWEDISSTQHIPGNVGGQLEPGAMAPFPAMAGRLPEVPWVGEGGAGGVLGRGGREPEVR